MASTNYKILHHEQMAMQCSIFQLRRYVKQVHNYWTWRTLTYILKPPTNNTFHH